VQSRRQELLDEARQDIEYFALLIDSWDRLVRASKSTNIVQP
jgi:hypothetical protein